MRLYSDFEQERILSAVVPREDPPSTRHAEMVDGARDPRAMKSSEPETTDDEPRQETPEVIQLLVDIESESKFANLLRSIQRRLYCFL
jgi:hypothetical protein